MRSRAWTTISKALTMFVLMATVLYGVSVVGLRERNFICRGIATGPATSEAMPEQGNLQISQYASFVQVLAHLFREDSIGDAEAVFHSEQTGTLSEHQLSVTASATSGSRQYTDFSAARDFLFDEATGELWIDHSGFVFRGSCLPVRLS